MFWSTGPLWGSTGGTDITPVTQNLGDPFPANNYGAQFRGNRHKIGRCVEEIAPGRCVEKTGQKFRKLEVFGRLLAVFGRLEMIMSFAISATKSGFWKICPILPGGGGGQFHLQVELFTHLVLGPWFRMEVKPHGEKGLSATLFGSAEVGY